jgi:hypothetical protein
MVPPGKRGGKRRKQFHTAASGETDPLESTKKVFNLSCFETTEKNIEIIKE